MHYAYVSEYFLDLSYSPSDVLPAAVYNAIHTGKLLGSGSNREQWLS